ncbi:MAG TPA: conjugal transfer protein TraD [Sphingomonas sp.]|jgi:hypothetical protein|nr:conjugal transfer protein TraD [Sphingomonas sp.]
MREGMVKRRERTRHLIELGGLVVKAGLVDLTDDDRATLYGAFLTVADRLRSEERDRALMLWQRKGKRAFDAASSSHHDDDATFSGLSSVSDHDRLAAP